MFTSQALKLEKTQLWMDGGEEERWWRRGKMVEKRNDGGEEERWWRRGMMAENRRDDGGEER